MDKERGNPKGPRNKMELVLALIVFAVLVLSWLVLPSTVSTTIEGTPAWSNVEGLQMAASEA